jgi:hypothetical protein
VARNWQVLRRFASDGQPCVLFIAAIPRDPPHSVAWLHHRFELRAVRGMLELRLPEAPDDGAVPDDEWRICYSMELRFVTGVEAVLKTLRGCGTLPAPPGGVPSMVLDVPSGTTAYGKMKFPSKLRVPRDARLERFARGWTADPSRTIPALQALESFERSTENVAAVQQCLNASVRTGRGKASTVRYPHRARAELLLERWGLPRPATVIEAPRDLYRPLGGRPQWLVAALVVLALTAVAGLRLRGRRARRFALRRPLVLAVAAALAATAVSLSMLGRRSHSHVDEVTFGTRSARHWVSSYNGCVQWVWIEAWTDAAVPGVTGGRYASFPLGGPLDGLWTEGPEVVSSRWGRWGFESLHGTMADPGGLGRPYRRVTLPMAALVAVAAAFPLLCVCLPLSRSLRRRVRRRRGQCVACGYDLRGSDRAGRCPECGGAMSSSTS